jgi:sterol desaturase/sphingolipid hydroxylase (fatty acid hydroxylase superfamily)
MFDTIFTNTINDLVETFLSPQKRVFLGYLLCAALMAIVWLIFRKKQTFFNAVKTLSSKQIWWSQSSKSDYKIALINKLLMSLLSPFLLTQIVIASSIFYALHDLFPSRPSLFDTHLPWAVNIIFTTSYFLLDDFARFYIHRLMHKWPVLWAFHKVHHSATTLTPLTVFRTHPIEMIIFTLRSSFVQATCIAGFVFFAGDGADLMTILGANIFVFFFNLLGSNLRHSHIAIAYWKPLEKIFISPAQHQIHHSSAHEHRDKNFGVILSIWDELFGSFYHSINDQHLDFGLSNTKLNPDKNAHSLTDLYLEPFNDAFSSLIITSNAFIKKIKLITKKLSNRRPNEHNKPTDINLHL